MAAAKEVLVKIIPEIDSTRIESGFALLKNEAAAAAAYANSLLDTSSTSFPVSTNFVPSMASSSFTPGGSPVDIGVQFGQLTASINSLNRATGRFSSDNQLLFNRMRTLLVDSGGGSQSQDMQRVLSAFERSYNQSFTALTRGLGKLDSSFERIGAVASRLDGLTRLSFERDQPAVQPVYGFASGSQPSTRIQDSPRVGQALGDRERVEQQRANVAQQKLQIEQAELQSLVRGRRFSAGPTSSSTQVIVGAAIGAPIASSAVARTATAVQDRQAVALRAVADVVVSSTQAQLAYLKSISSDNSKRNGLLDNLLYSRGSMGAVGSGSGSGTSSVYVQASQFRELEKALVSRFAGGIQYDSVLPQNASRSAASVQSLSRPGRSTVQPQISSAGIVSPVKSYSQQSQRSGLGALFDRFSWRPRRRGQAGSIGAEDFESFLSGAPTSRWQDLFGLTNYRQNINNFTRLPSASPEASKQAESFFRRKAGVSDEEIRGMSSIARGRVRRLAIASLSEDFERAEQAYLDSAYNALGSFTESAGTRAAATSRGRDLRIREAIDSILGGQLPVPGRSAQEALASFRTRGTLSGSVSFDERSVSVIPKVDGSLASKFIDTTMLRVLGIGSGRSSIIGNPSRQEQATLTELYSRLRVLLDSSTMLQENVGTLLGASGAQSVSLDPYLRTQQLLYGFAKQQNLILPEERSPLAISRDMSEADALARRQTAERRKQEEIDNTRGAADARIRALKEARLASGETFLGSEWQDSSKFNSALFDSLFPNFGPTTPGYTRALRADRRLQRAGEQPFNIEQLQKSMIEEVLPNVQPFLNAMYGPRFSELRSQKKISGFSREELFQESLMRMLAASARSPDSSAARMVSGAVELPGSLSTSPQRDNVIEAIKAYVFSTQSSLARDALRTSKKQNTGSLMLNSAFGEDDSGIINMTDILDESFVLTAQSRPQTALDRFISQYRADIESDPSVSEAQKNLAPLVEGRDSLTNRIQAADRDLFKKRAELESIIGREASSGRVLQSDFSLDDTERAAFNATGRTDQVISDSIALVAERDKLIEERSATNEVIDRVRSDLNDAVVSARKQIRAYRQKSGIPLPIDPADFEIYSAPSEVINQLIQSPDLADQPIFDSDRTLSTYGTRGTPGLAQARRADKEAAKQGYPQKFEDQLKRDILSQISSGRIAAALQNNTSISQTVDMERLARVIFGEAGWLDSGRGSSSLVDLSGFKSNLSSLLMGVMRGATFPDLEGNPSSLAPEDVLAALGAPDGTSKNAPADQLRRLRESLANWTRVVAFGEDGKPIRGGSLGGFDRDMERLLSASGFFPWQRKLIGREGSARALELIAKVREGATLKGPDLSAVETARQQAELELVQLAAQRGAGAGRVPLAPDNVLSEYNRRYGNIPYGATAGGGPGRIPIDVPRTPITLGRTTSTPMFLGRRAEVFTASDQLAASQKIAQDIQAWASNLYVGVQSSGGLFDSLFGGTTEPSPSPASAPGALIFSSQQAALLKDAVNKISALAQRRRMGADYSNRIGSLDIEAGLKAIDEFIPELSQFLAQEIPGFASPSGEGPLTMRDVAREILLLSGRSDVRTGMLTGRYQSIEKGLSKEQMLSLLTPDVVRNAPSYERRVEFPLRPFSLPSVNDREAKLKASADELEIRTLRRELEQQRLASYQIPSDTASVIGDQKFWGNTSITEEMFSRQLLQRMYGLANPGTLGSPELNQAESAVIRDVLSPVMPWRGKAGAPPQILRLAAASQPSIAELEARRTSLSAQLAANSDVIAAAASEGDISENAGYDAAMAKKTELEQKIIDTTKQINAISSGSDVLNKEFDAFLNSLRSLSSNQVIARIASIRRDIVEQLSAIPEIDRPIIQGNINKRTAVQPLGGEGPADFGFIGPARTAREIIARVNAKTGTSDTAGMTFQVAQALGAEISENAELIGVGQITRPNTRNLIKAKEILANNMSLVDQILENYNSILASAARSSTGIYLPQKAAEAQLPGFDPETSKQVFSSLVTVMRAEIVDFFDRFDRTSREFPNTEFRPPMLLAAEFPRPESQAMGIGRMSRQEAARAVGGALDSRALGDSSFDSTGVDPVAAEQKRLDEEDRKNKQRIDDDNRRNFERESRWRKSSEERRGRRRRGRGQGGSVGSLIAGIFGDRPVLTKEANADVAMRELVSSLERGKFPESGNASGLTEYYRGITSESLRSRAAVRSAGLAPTVLRDGKFETLTSEELAQLGMLARSIRKTRNLGSDFRISLKEGVADSLSPSIGVSDTRGVYSQVDSSRAISRIVQSWANSSSSDVSNLIQMRLSEMLGYESGYNRKPSSSVVDIINRNRVVTQQGYQPINFDSKELSMLNVPESLNAGISGIDNLIRTMYTQTQTLLRSLRIDGFAAARAQWNPVDPKPGRYLEDRSMLSSWSPSILEAQEFALGGSIRQAVIPSSAILSTPRTGFGSAIEDEITVIGSALSDFVYRFLPASPSGDIVQRVSKLRRQGALEPGELPQIAGLSPELQRRLGLYVPDASSLGLGAQPTRSSSMALALEEARRQVDEESSATRRSRGQGGSVGSRGQRGSVGDMGEGYRKAFSDIDAEYQRAAAGLGLPSPELSAAEVDRLNSRFANRSLYSQPIPETAYRAIDAVYRGGGLQRRPDASASGSTPISPELAARTARLVRAARSRASSKPSGWFDDPNPKPSGQFDLTPSAPPPRPPRRPIGPRAMSVLTNLLSGGSLAMAGLGGALAGPQAAAFGLGLFGASEVFRQLEYLGQTRLAPRLANRRVYKAQEEVNIERRRLAYARNAKILATSGVEASNADKNLSVRESEYSKANNRYEEARALSAERAAFADEVRFARQQAFSNFRSNLGDRASDLGSLGRSAISGLRSGASWLYGRGISGFQSLRGYVGGLVSDFRGGNNAPLAAGNDLFSALGLPYAMGGVSTRGSGSGEGWGRMLQDAVSKKVGPDGKIPDNLQALLDKMSKIPSLQREQDLATLGFGKTAAVDYDALTVKELRDLALSQGISGRSKMNKQQLVDALKASQSVPFDSSSISDAAVKSAYRKLQFELHPDQLGRPQTPEERDRQQRVQDSYDRLTNSRPTGSVAQNIQQYMSDFNNGITPFALNDPRVLDATKAMPYGAAINQDFMAALSGAQGREMQAAARKDMTSYRERQLRARWEQAALDRFGPPEGGGKSGPKAAGMNSWGQMYGLGNLGDMGGGGDGPPPPNVGGFGAYGPEGGPGRWARFVNRVKGGPEGSAGRFFGQGLLSTIKYGLPGMVMYQGLFGLQQQVADAEEYRVALSRLGDQVASTFGSESSQYVERFKNNISDVALETGVSSSQLMVMERQIVGSFAKVGSPGGSRSYLASDFSGLRGADLIDAQTRSAAGLSRVFNVTPGEIGNQATATSLSFGKTFENIGDVAIAVENFTGVPGKELIDFLGDVGPVAKNAGFSLEQFAAIGGLALQKSGQSGSSLAEKFNRIIPALSETKDQLIQLAVTQPALGGDKLLEDIGANRMSEVFITILQNYSKLDKASQGFVENLVGGRREAQSLAGILKDPATLKELEQAADKSLGSMQKRLESIQGNISIVWDKVKEGFQQFTQGLLAMGLGDFISQFGSMFAVVTGSVKYASQAFSTINDLSGGLVSNLLAAGIAIQLFSKVAARVPFLGSWGAAGALMPSLKRGSMVAGAAESLVIPALMQRDDMAVMGAAGARPPAFGSAAAVAAGAAGARPPAFGPAPSSTIVTPWGASSRAASYRGLRLQALDDGRIQIQSRQGLFGKSTRGAFFGKYRPLETLAADATQAQIVATTEALGAQQTARAAAGGAARAGAAAAAGFLATPMGAIVGIGLVAAAANWVIDGIGEMNRAAKDIRDQVLAEAKSENFTKTDWQNIASRNSKIYTQVQEDEGWKSIVFGRIFGTDRPQDLLQAKAQFETGNLKRFEELLPEVSSKTATPGGSIKTAEQKIAYDYFIGTVEEEVGGRKAFLDDPWYQASDRQNTRANFGRNFGGRSRKTASDTAKRKDTSAVNRGMAKLYLKLLDSSGSDTLDEEILNAAVSEDPIGELTKIATGDKSSKNQKPAEKILADFMAKQGETGPLGSMISNYLGSAQAGGVSNLTDFSNVYGQTQGARLSASMMNVDQAQAAFEAGQISLETYLRSYGEYEKGVQKVLDAGSNPEQAKELAKRAKIRNKLYSDAKQRQIEGYSVIMDLLGATGREVADYQVDNLKTLLTDKNIGGKERLEVAKSLRQAEKQQFSIMLGLASTASEVDQILADSGRSNAEFSAIVSGLFTSENDAFGKLQDAANLLDGFGALDVPYSGGSADAQERRGENWVFDELKNPNNLVSRVVEARLSGDTSGIMQELQTVQKDTIAAANQVIPEGASPAERAIMQGSIDAAKAALPGIMDMMRFLQEGGNLFGVNVEELKKAQDAAKAIAGENRKFELFQGDANIQKAVKSRNRRAQADIDLSTAIEKEASAKRRKDLGDENADRDIKAAQAEQASARWSRIDADIAIADSRSNLIAGRRSIAGDDVGAATEKARRARQKASQLAAQAKSGAADQGVADDALAEAEQAQEDVRKARIAQREALFGEQKALLGKNSVAKAQADVATAQRLFGDAKGAKQKAEARIGIIDAMERLDDEMAAARDAHFELQIAQLEAMDTDDATNQAAQIRVQKIQAEIARITKAGGGAKELDPLRAQLVTAQKAANDVVFDQQNEYAQWQYDMGMTTKSQLVTFLKQQLATLPENTDAYRRLALQIRNLEKQGQDNQMGIPGNIKLPTLYEARRLNQSVDATTNQSYGYQDNRINNVTIYVNNGSQENVVAALGQVLGSDRAPSTPRRF